MVNESAPPVGRVRRRAMAGLAAWLLLLLSPGAAPAQDQKGAPKGEDEKAASKDAPPAEKSAEESEQEAAAKKEAEEVAILEDSIFVDPRSQQAMDNSFEELFRRVPAAGQTLQAMLRMARGEIRVDPAQIARHIEGSARELTDHANIESVLKPGGTADQRRVKSMEDAGQALSAPLRVPNRDASFSHEYGAKLLQVAPDLLKNHMLARVQIMLALSELGEAAALDTFIKVLDEPQNPVVLKQLAAQGITTIAGAPNRPLQLNDTVRAAEALARFLDNPEETFWLARVRALEALGSLRQISTIQQRDQALMAQVALRILANPDERPMVRAWAAWALGRYDVPAGYPQINYSLLAYQMGRLAVDLGDSIVDLGDSIVTTKRDRARYLTAIMAFQVFPGLNGTAELRGSGLVNARGLGAHQAYVNQIQILVKQLAAECVTLTRAVGSQIGPALDAVNGRLAELKTYLEKNPPPADPLVPGVPAMAIGGPAPAPNPGQ